MVVANKSSDLPLRRLLRPQLDSLEPPKPVAMAVFRHCCATCGRLGAGEAQAPRSTIICEGIQFFAFQPRRVAGKMQLPVRGPRVVPQLVAMAEPRRSEAGYRGMSGWQAQKLCSCAFVKIAIGCHKSRHFHFFVFHFFFVFDVGCWRIFIF